MTHYLLLPNLHIHNAYAMSSSYTIGFPAITGWLGAVHALERNLKANGFSNLRCHVRPHKYTTVSRIMQELIAYFSKKHCIICICGV